MARWILRHQSSLFWSHDEAATQAFSWPARRYIRYTRPEILQSSIQPTSTKRLWFQLNMMIPKKTTVLVVGGGPGGSYAAAVLARENIDVTVLEADKFPRYHVGESQLAALRHFLRFIDLEEEFDAFGFQRKVGGGFKMNKHKREGYSDFISHDPKNYSWHVIRSDSDQLMLRYASRVGAKVFEETKVTDVEFDVAGEGQEARPVAAVWLGKDGSTGRIYFDYIIDASGRAGILSTRYLKNREFNDKLKNVAFWGYWTGAGRYMAGTPREDSIFVEALTDETGWVWFIPLHDGTTSVGVVMDQEKSNVSRAAVKAAGGNGSLNAHYLRQLKLVPAIQELMGDAKLVKKPDAPLVSSASDYSYAARYHAGPRYRIIGDAGAFIDPFFSSGVHLAVSGGLSAAATICATMKGECSELDAARWHTTKVNSSYTRFLLVVLSAYHQIQSQDSPILSAQEDDNFDFAFDFFRPIIQGNTESGRKFADDDLGKTIEFLGKHVFEPSYPEQRAELVSLYGDQLDVVPKLRVPGEDDAQAESKAILKHMAVQKLIRMEDVAHIGNYVSDVFEGYRLRLKRGELGLDKAA
ncbi:FAD/NAD(P)-binding domain-containing protein [Guyanagaster necrorhizus]|uniref:FAD/NAD(P)-binding domain-containing protein n=1 Tax=Guyanagaster necrorhizus TaxID=856835 RepID=A0A9P8ALK9_9AGAR|nr:FAD/NAD(P)-binding domain-containing protein [Guyanagaster necrorhizus MCA 3950]KAG7439819.1 FAD/NAD(P)-binding domain-containing protein [Guyanagaster necrorhizus MCA 3950]